MWHWCLVAKRLDGSRCHLVWKWASAQATCVRWRPSSPPPKGAKLPPLFGPCLLWPNGSMDEDATWYGGRPRPRRHCVRWRTQLPLKRGTAPTFRPMSIVAKRSPISATASTCSIFQDGCRHHLGFLNFWNVSRRNAQEGETAAPCQTSSKSLKPRPRYSNFSILKDGGRRHLAFLNFWNFNGRNAQEGQTASPCQSSWKSEPPWDLVLG